MMASLLLKGVADWEEARMARRSPSLTLSIKGSDNCCPWPTAIYHLEDLKYSDPLVRCTEPFVSRTGSTGAVQYDEHSPRSKAWSLKAQQNESLVTIDHPPRSRNQETPDLVSFTVAE